MQKIEEQIMRTEGCLTAVEEAGAGKSWDKIQASVLDILEFIGMATDRIGRAAKMETPLKYKKLMGTVHDVREEASIICYALGVHPRYEDLRTEIKKSMEMFDRFLAGNASIMVVSWTIDLAVEH